MTVIDITARSPNMDEMIEGYHDGSNGEPRPGNNRSDGYIQGWENGAVDGGYMQKTAKQALRAKVFLNNQGDNRQ